MNYPTLEQVKESNVIQLATWFRFLESPGMSGVGKQDFLQILKDESDIMREIIKRFKSLGGMNPEISKIIGWDNKPNMSVEDLEEMSR